MGLSSITILLRYFRKKTKSFNTTLKRGEGVKTVRFAIFGKELFRQDRLSLLFKYILCDVSRNVSVFNFLT